MKLAVSNIAWGADGTAEFLSLLKALGCHGVEVAPSLWWDEPVDASAGERDQYRDMVTTAGLEVCGLHSLFYSRPDLRILGEGADLDASAAYLIGLVDLCADLGGRTMVFGSPKSRERGPLPFEDAVDGAARFFQLCVQRAADRDVLLLIEPLGPDESDFITSVDEAARLVQRVGHPNFALHLDTKAMVTAGEDVDAICRTYAGAFHHVHVGDPGLCPPGSTDVDHAPIGKALRASGYTGYVSLEIRRNFGPPADVIGQSVAYIKQHYLSER